MSRSNLLRVVVEMLVSFFISSFISFVKTCSSKNPRYENFPIKLKIHKKIIIVDIIPKQYKPHHESILSGLKSIDFDKIKSRKLVDTHLAKYIGDERVRQFLLKNLHWVDKESLGLKLNIEVLFEFKDKLSIKLKKEINFDKPSLFLYGDSSTYVDESDFPMLYSNFSNIEIIKVPFSGHWVHADNPSFFIDKTINFLN